MSKKSKASAMKCGWCGAMVERSGTGARLRQHLNGGETCVGSSQPVAQHEFVSRLKFNNMVR